MQRVARAALAAAVSASQACSAARKAHPRRRRRELDEQKRPQEHAQRDFDRYGVERRDDKLDAPIRPPTQESLGRAHGDRVQSIVGTPDPLGEAMQATRIQSFRRQSGHQLPPARAREASVSVGTGRRRTPSRVPGRSPRDGPWRAAGTVECDAGRCGPARATCHRVRPKPDPFGEAHQHRFGLIVERVGGREPAGPDGAGMVEQEAIARIARGGLRHRSGRSPPPGQNAVAQAEPACLKPNGGGLVG